MFDHSAWIFLQVQLLQKKKKKFSGNCPLNSVFYSIKLIETVKVKNSFVSDGVWLSVSVSV